MSDFFQRFKDIRLKLRKKQVEFAKDIGAAQRSIGYYESDRYPSADVLARLVEVYNVNIYFLLLGGDEPMFRDGPAGESTETKELQLAQSDFMELFREKQKVNKELEELKLKNEELQNMVQYLETQNKTGSSSANEHPPNSWHGTGASKVAEKPK